MNIFVAKLNFKTTSEELLALFPKDLVSLKCPTKRKLMLQSTNSMSQKLMAGLS